MTRKKSESSKLPKEKGKWKVKVAENDMRHLRERIWRVVDYARMLGVSISPDEALDLVLIAVETAAASKNYPPEKIPKVLVNAVLNLSGKLLPVYAIVLQDEKRKIRYVKTVWTKLETL